MLDDVVASAKQKAFILKAAWEFSKPVDWMTPEEAAFVSDYMGKHPGKKLNRFLRMKLRIEYYQYLKSKNKKSTVKGAKESESIKSNQHSKEESSQRENTEDR